MEEKFDNFHIHRMDANALKDLPASIDYILGVTGHKNLNLVSMSKGGYVSLALLSSRPEYNDKVRLHFTMVPVTAVTQPRGWIKYFMEFHRFMVGKVSSLRRPERLQSHAVS